MSGPMDERRLEEMIESELRALVERGVLNSSVSIERLEVGPLEAGSGTGEVARAVAGALAAAIRG